MSIKYLAFLILLLLLIIVNAQKSRVFCRGKRGWGQCTANNKECNLRRYRDKFCGANTMCCAM